MAPRGGIVRWRSWGESFTKLEICLSVAVLALVVTTVLLECVWIAKTASVEEPPPKDEHDPAYETLQNLNRLQKPWPRDGRFLTIVELGSLAMLALPNEEPFCSAALLNPKIGLTTADCANQCTKPCKIRVPLYEIDIPSNRDPGTGNSSNVSVMEYDMIDKASANDPDGKKLNLVAFHMNEDTSTLRFTRYLAGPRMMLQLGDVLLALLDRNGTTPFGLPIIKGDSNATELPHGTPLMRGEALYGFAGDLPGLIIEVEDAGQWISDYVSGKI